VGEKNASLVYKLDSSTKVLTKVKQCWKTVSSCSLTCKISISTCLRSFSMFCWSVLPWWLSPWQRESSTLEVEILSPVTELALRTGTSCDSLLLPPSRAGNQTISNIRDMKTIHFKWCEIKNSKMVSTQYTSVKFEHMTCNAWCFSSFNHWHCS